MKLIPDWRQAHSFWSIQISLLGAIFSGAWVALPAFQGYLPPTYFAVVCIVVSILVVLLRLIDQPNVPTRGDPSV
jgi:hypothetical protein